MGTVGLAFGSATSGAGFDVTTTVSAILGIEQGVETPWKSQLASLKAQDAAFTSLGTDLSNLTTRLQALTDFEGVLASKQGSSSDTSSLALTSATALATAGGHEIIINSLAQTSSFSTSAVVAGDELSGSLTIKVGSGPATTVAVDPADTSLAGLAKAINFAGIGVRASVLSDANGSRLSLVSATSGSAGQLTVSSTLHDSTTSTAVGLIAGHTGQDASLTVDGIAITSSSNSVSNAIPGVTFQLLNITTSAVQVEITNDASSVSSAVNDFVTAYNAVAANLKSQEGKDSSGAAKPLYGDPTVALLQTQLSSALLRGAASGRINSLTQLGVELKQDGTLSYSESAFRAAYDKSPEDLTGFLQNAQSFGTTFNAVLNGLGTANTSGAIYLAEQQNTAQEKTLNDSISATETRIAAQRIRLTKELNLANQILQNIPAQLDEINQIYSAVTGYNTK